MPLRLNSLATFPRTLAAFPNVSVLLDSRRASFGGLGLVFFDPIFVFPVGSVARPPWGFPAVGPLSLAYLGEQ